MSTVFSEQRTAVLVDVQNLFYSAKSILQAKIDYSKLLNGLSEGRSVVRAIAYVVQRPDVSQTNFIDALSRIGFEIRIKEAKNRKDNGGKVVPSKGSYGVMVALDAAELVSKVDNIILVTGDSEYVPLAQYLKARGCRVEVAAFDESVSNELADTADEFIPIAEEWTFPDQKLQEQAAAPAVVGEMPDFDVEQPASHESAPVFAKK